MVALSSDCKVYTSGRLYLDGSWSLLSGNHASVVLSSSTALGNRIPWLPWGSLWASWTAVFPDQRQIFGMGRGQELLLSTPLPIKEKVYTDIELLRFPKMEVPNSCMAHHGKKVHEWMMNGVPAFQETSKWKKIKSCPFQGDSGHILGVNELLR